MLHVYAVNGAVEGRHTYLSRSAGEAVALPDLAGWLGFRQGGLNTDEIELFPASDLAGMALSDYITSAFDLDSKPDAQTSARINALEGHVLLIPDGALAGEVIATEALTPIATLPMARADHSSAALEPAPLGYAEPSKDSIGGHTDKKRHWPKLLIAIAVALVVILFQLMAEQP